MKRVILPAGCGDDRHAALQDAPGMSLGGCFYDHLRSADGRVVGVRYWLMECDDVSQHPVYAQFLTDERFSFDEAGNYVDIIFDEQDSGLLHAGELASDGAQDFGGESVLRVGHHYAIVIVLDDGCLTKEGATACPP